MAQFCCIWTYQGLILILCLMGVLQLLDTQRQHRTFMSFLTKTKTKNNCLKFLVNRIITELLLQCTEWVRNTFLHLFHRKKLLTQPGKCVHMRNPPPLPPVPLPRPRSRSAVGKISVRRGNFQLIWTEIFCCWKLALWWDFVEIISPPRRDNFSHMNSPLISRNSAAITFTSLL